MELYFLQGNPPHCPEWLESLIATHGAKIACCHPDDLFAVLVAKPEEENWFDWAITQTRTVKQLFPSTLITKWKPDTHQVILGLIEK